MSFKYPLRFKIKAASDFNTDDCVGTVVEFTGLSEGTVVVGSEYYSVGLKGRTWVEHTNTKCWEPVVTESVDNQAVLEVTERCKCFRNLCDKHQSTTRASERLFDQSLDQERTLEISAKPSLLTRVVRWSVLAITSVVFSIKSLFKGGK